MPKKAKHVNKILYGAIKNFLESKNIENFKNIALRGFVEELINHLMLA